MKDKWKALTKLQLEQHFKDGLWYDDIGEIYKITDRAVRDKVKKFNIVLPRKNAVKKIQPHEILICSHCKKEYSQDKNSGFCSNNCKISKELLETQNLEKGTRTDLGANILRLRKQGLSYNKIVKELGCSKSTVAYYCNDTTKEKIIQLKDNHELKKFMSQLDNYKQRDMNTNTVNMCKDWNKKFRSSCSRFRNKNKMEIKNKFTYHDAIDHLGGKITKCYLTGREIDITKDDFSLDHIIPIAKGGSCELENMGITIPEANSMKSDLILEDFFSLCKEILQNNGYEVWKKS